MQTGEYIDCRERIFKSDRFWLCEVRQWTNVYTLWNTGLSTSTVTETDERSASLCCLAGNYQTQRLRKISRLVRNQSRWLIKDDAVLLPRWTFAVLCFEMAAGQPPFSGKDHIQLYE